MKLDSISALSEIALYYGTLDDVFRLMKKLNINTNQMWETTWVQLSKKINRKKISFKWRSRKEFVEIPLKCPLLLTLFKTSVINIQEEEELNWLIELYENIENPKMLSMWLGLSLRTCLDTCMTLQNYQEYIKETDLDNLDLYNKVVDIAIKRGIDLKDIYSFVYLNDLPRLKDAQYIKFIVIIWNQESDVGLIIKNWTDFYESKEVDFGTVWLIWDGMWIKNFIKIFSTLCNKRFETGVITIKDWKQLALFLDEIKSLQVNNSYFKMGDDNEFVIWKLIREASTTNLKKWYYQSIKWRDYAVEITKAIIKHSNENITNISHNFVIRQDQIQYFWLNFMPIYIDDNVSIKLSNAISFNENIIEFYPSIIKNSVLRINVTEKWAYILYWKIPFTSDVILKAKYLNKESGIQLKVDNISLNEEDIESIQKLLMNLNNVTAVSFIIDKPSSAFTFLNFCIELPFLISIHLKIKRKPNIIEFFEVGDSVVTLIGMKKKVKVIWLNYIY